MYLVKFIHYHSVSKAWVAFSLHSGLVQLSSVRVSLIPLYSPPALFPCAQMNAHPIPPRFVLPLQITNLTVHNRGLCDKLLFGNVFWKRDPTGSESQNETQRATILPVGASPLLSVSATE